MPPRHYLCLGNVYEVIESEKVQNRNKILNWLINPRGQDQEPARNAQFRC